MRPVLRCVNFLFLFGFMSIGYGADAGWETNILDIHLNANVLQALGIQVAVVSDAQPTSDSSLEPGYTGYRFRVLPLDFSDFRLTKGSVTSQRVRIRGGLLIVSGEKLIDIREGFLIPHATDPLAWTLTSNDGAAWFEIDHAHQSSNEGRLSLHEANLAMGAGAASYLHRPETVGMVLGGIDLELAPVSSSSEPEAMHETCHAPWPSPASPARIRLIDATSNAQTQRPDTIAFERCMRRTEAGNWDACTAQSNDGLAIFAPDASLRNVGNTAVPWYPRFSGRHPPYDNDQHPFLIWNLYRLDPDGVLRQIARSGVKHAFFAVNAECTCRSEHIVFPSCVDTYSSYNNDSIDVLGPRGEVLPALGIWGRCGSVADPSCDGNPVPRGPPTSEDSLRYRMAVREAAIDLSMHPGSEYFFEYGYLVRDSDKPDGAFGYREVKLTKIPGVARAAAWTIEHGRLAQGLVIDAWAKTDAPNDAFALADIVTSYGTVRVGEKVARLRNGKYRYRYAVANIDFAVADISGQGDMLRLSNPHGISAISLPTEFAVKLSNSGTTSEDIVPGKPWALISNARSLRWKASEGNELTWGELMTIYFDSDVRPMPRRIELTVETSAGDERTFSGLIPEPRRK